jgi:multiple sugar transport system substrate-binding protein
MNRRRFLKLTGAGLAGASLLGVAGCGGGRGGNQDGVAEFTFAMGPDNTGTLSRLVARFNQQNKGRFRADYREMPADTGQYFDQLRTEFQAGSSDITVIGGDVIWPAQLAASGYIEPLGDRFTEEERQAFLQGPVESNVYEGEVYGVPWYTDAGMLFYRRDLLEKSGISEPPRTWEELKEQAQKVQRDSRTKYGFVFQGAEFEGGVVNALEYVWSHGGDVLEEGSSDRVIIDSPESVAGLATMRGMIEGGVAPQSVANFTSTESHSAFLNGDAVFLRNWPYTYALAGSEDFPNVTQEQVGVAPLPAGPEGSVSGLGGWNFYINANSDDSLKDAAYEFVKFMTAPEQQKVYALEGSYLPTRAALYEDREILDAIPVIARAGEALRRTRPRPRSPYYSDMSLKMAEQFNGVVNGDVEPQRAVSTLQDELTEIARQEE